MLALVLATTLAGTVAAPDGTPVQGAAVIVFDGHRTATATTDRAGAFEAPGVTLPAVVEVSAPGYAAARRRVDATPVAIVLTPATLRESVIVTAAGAPPVWRDPTSGRTVLAAADVAAVPAVTLDETLHVISGFSLYRRTSAGASNPTTHGVTMRGLSASGSSRGLVVLDGVPLTDGFGGWVTWTRLPALAVGRVEIDRGAEAETFGTDALGGVVDIITPSAARASAEAAVQAGSDGVAGVDLAGARPAGRLSLFGAASGFRTDGTVPVEPASRGPVDRPADAHWANGFGRASVAWGSQRLTFSGWGGRDNRGNGTVLQVNHMEGGTFAAAYDAVGGAGRVSARVAVSPNDFYQTFSSVTTVAGVARAGETLTSTQFVRTLTTHVQVEAGRTVPRGFIGARINVGHATSTFTEVKPAGTTASNLRDDADAASLQASLAVLPRWSVGAGVRQEWRAAPVASAAYDPATVGRVTTSWRAGGPVVFRASVATSHRWATLNELVRNFQVGAILTEANPALRPERGRSADAAVTVTRSWWDLAAGGFWSVLHDAIANVTIGTNLRQRRNAGEARSRGAELDGSLRVAAALRVRASATWSDATFQQSADPALEGLRLPQVPRLSGAVSAEIALPRAMQASVVWHGTASQFDDDRNVFLLAPAFQTDLRVQGRAGVWGWHVDVENAFDNRIETARTPLVSLAAGRSVRVGVDWRR